MRKYENGAYLQQLQGGGGGVGVLQLELGPGVVEDGEEGEVAGVGVVAAEDEQGAEDGEEDGEDDVEDVEPGVEGKQLEAGVQGVASLLRQLGVVLLDLLLLLQLVRGVVREELVLLIISKGNALLRFGFESGGHFVTSSLRGGLQWNGGNFAWHHIFEHLTFGFVFL